MNRNNAQVYIVATPIGNKSDLSLRAIEILKSVDIVACEDSRTSANLLEAYGITTTLVSYHKFNEKQRTEEFLNLLNEGKKIPCVSDPGRILVKELFEHDIKITSIPGASAITTFVSMIPRESEEFAFCGFLPRAASQQTKIFDKFVNTDLVFYESPLRLIETLKNILNVRGNTSRIAIGRELTKMFEEIKTGMVEEIIDYYTNNTLKGEIVCMLYAQSSVQADDTEFIQKIQKLKNQNYSDKDISQILSTLYGLNKNKIYKLALSVK